MSHGYPLARKERLYYAQYDAEYSVKGNGDNIIKAEKYKINLYYNPLKRAEAICDIQHAIDEQKEDADKLITSKEAVADCYDTRRCLNMLTVKFNEDRSVASYEVNSEKAENMILTAGFFASKTIGVDFCNMQYGSNLDPMQAKNSYGMRDEQEKAFALQKGPLNQDRLRTWSEGGKHEGCSYALRASSSPHMCAICGRRTNICTRSSTRPRPCLRE